MRIRISRAGRRNALAMLPLLATGAALAWPQSSGGAIQSALAVAVSPSTQASPVPVCPVSQLCPTPTPSPRHSPSPSPHPTPPKASPTPHPTAAGGGGGGGGNPQPVPPPATVVGPAVQPPPSGTDNLVGLSGGPPTPPAVPGSRLDIISDPQNPDAGGTALITVTISGSRGSDRYGVPNLPVTLQLVEKPDNQANLSATDLTTDVTGSAIARLTLSRARGRHVLKATGGGLTNQLLLDTLSGSRVTSGRARHDGVLGLVKAPAVNPNFLFGAGVAVLVISFLLPYRRRAYALVGRPHGPRPARTGRAAVQALVPPDAPAVSALSPALETAEPVVAAGTPEVTVAEPPKPKRAPRTTRPSAAPPG